MSCVLTVPQPWLEETTSELSLAYLLEGSCGGGFYNGGQLWTRASIETITFILHKPSKPSLYLFLSLLLDLEARSSHLGVLGLWFGRFMVFVGFPRTSSSEIETLSQFTLFHAMRWSWGTQPGFLLDGRELESFL